MPWMPRCRSCPATSSRCHSATSKGLSAAFLQATTEPEEGTLKQRAHQLAVYLEEPVYNKPRDIAFHERTKLHPLILEGIDLVLEKHGMPSIKEQTKTAG